MDPAGGRSAEELAELAERMAATLAHRGPDDRGVWADPAAGVSLGFRRLAILDLSERGAQPMVSASGRWVAVFNGEVYNFGDLRRDLERAGVRFRGRSDTEVLVEAVDHWGPRAALERADGMLALGLWDRRRQALVLARDRLGEKPLYYGRVGTGLVFGSELKALRAHPGFRAEVDREALALYLRYGYVPGPRTIYRGVHKLPPGCLLTVPFGSGAAGAAGEPEPFWLLRDVVEAGTRDPLRGTAGEVVGEVERALQESVAERMVADVPLGAFLSGGVDSSLLVALMQAAAPRPVRTFTIGFREAGFDEAPHARRVAAHLGTDHTEAYVTAREVQEAVPRLPAVYDEPFADSSQLPTLLLAELTAGHVRVSVSGDGGDELFGGYTRYQVHRRLERVGRLPAPLRRSLAAAVAAVPARAWDRALGAAATVLPTLRVRNPGAAAHRIASLLAEDDAGRRYRALVSGWHDAGAVVAGGVTEPTTAFTDPASWPARVDGLGFPLFVDSLTYLPDDLLVKVDRATMAASLESRAPFLARRVVELAWRIPADLKFREGGGKWVLRQVLDRYVPRALVDRPKMGFGVPVGDWLRGPLRPWAESLLTRRRLRQEGYFDSEPVLALWCDHLESRRDGTQALWSVLMFQAWLERSPQLGAGATPPGRGRSTVPGVGAHEAGG